jgi:hypothetical protein
MTYTAQLTTGIKDKVGNSMAEDYSWQFSTESLQNIAVTLPDNASEVNFGIVRPHLTSKVRIVSISSTGIEDLVIDTISLSGSHTGDFTILEDKCSGTALTQFENCTARIKFSPSSKGLKQATLSISSNDPDTPTYDVSLKGIGARAKVLLLSPNGGEVIPSGSTETINWGVASGVSKVTLSYSMDGGKTWSVIGKNLTGTNRDWTVPSPTGNKKKCFIQVTGYSSKNKKVASDTSDAPFAIEVVKLTSPNGPEPLVSGSTQEISWEVNGTAKPVATIELFYTGDGGKSWSLIESLSGTDRSHEWTVPDIDKPKCKVKVLLKDEKGKPLGNDLSDNWFAIEL